MSAGPVWTRRLADAAIGSDPAAGGVYSNGYFDGQRLYYASGQTTIAGKPAAGAVRALDPRTGAVIWERAMPSRTYGALTGANGMLVVPTRTALRLFDPATGEILYENTLGLYAAAKVANGRLFIGDVAGVVHAYAYPSAPGAPVTANAALAAGCQATPASSLPSVLPGSRVELTRLDQGDPATLQLYRGDNCAGHPLVQTTLERGESRIVRVPSSVARADSLSLAAQSTMRVKVTRSAK